MKPEKIGKYKILSVIGKGAMGVVYKGHDPVLRRQVAIKTLYPELLGGEEQRIRFFREAEAPGRLGHPNIVNVFDLAEEGDTPNIVMEYLVGFDLKRFRDAGIRFTIPQILNILKQVATGLEYAHRHGVVHRDVKPANILLLENDVIKIVDFGVAKVAQSAFQTCVGRSLGTPAYMSPEQVRGDKVGQWTDQFSLGVISYELIQGANPYIAETLPGLLSRIATYDPTPLSEIVPDCPPELGLVVMQMLEKDYRSRLPNLLNLVYTCGKLLHKFSPEESYLEPVYLKLKDWLDKHPEPDTQSTEESTSSMPAQSFSHEPIDVEDLPGLSVPDGSESSDSSESPASEADKNLERMVRAAGYSPDDQTILLGSPSQTKIKHAVTGKLPEDTPMRDNPSPARPVERRQSPGAAASVAGKGIPSTPKPAANDIPESDRTFAIAPERLLDVAIEMANSPPAPQGSMLTEGSPRKPGVQKQPGGHNSEASPETAHPSRLGDESLVRKSTKGGTDELFSQKLVKVPTSDKSTVKAPSPISSTKFIKPKQRSGGKWWLIIPLVLIVCFIGYLSPLSDNWTGVSGWRVAEKIDFLKNSILGLFNSEQRPVAAEPQQPEKPAEQEQPQTPPSERMARLYLTEARKALVNGDLAAVQEKLSQFEKLGFADLQPEADRLKEVLRTSLAAQAALLAEEEAKSLLDQGERLLANGDLDQASQKIDQLEALQTEKYRDDVAEIRRRIEQKKLDRNQQASQSQKAATTLRLLADAEQFLARGNPEMAERQVERAEFLQVPSLAERVMAMRKRVLEAKNKASTGGGSSAESRARKLIAEIENLIDEGKVEEAKQKLIEAEKLGVAAINQDIQRLIEKIRRLQ